MVKHMKDLLLRLLGGTDNMIYALTMFVVMNYITAILVAIVEKKMDKEETGAKKPYLERLALLSLSVLPILLIR